jgi:poly(3-hydroxybutyrate) depolymerase
LRHTTLTRVRTGLVVLVAGLALAAGAAPGLADSALAGPPAVAAQRGAKAGVAQFTVLRGQTLPRLTSTARPYRADVTVPIGAVDRSFRVFVPPGLTGPAPTVVTMSGFGLTGDPELYMGWQRLAVARKFVVIYLRGDGASYNAGRCCGPAARHDIDDSAALIRMLEVENSLYPQDRSRLYVTGYSNGGMMAYRFACEHPGLVAGIGVVGGAYMARGVCTPRAAVPVMHVHGKLDRTVPFAGTAWSALLRTSIPSVAQTNAVFGRLNARHGVPVKNVNLAGVGHGWPHQIGSRYDATAQLAAFLLRFRR